MTIYVKKIADDKQDSFFYDNEVIAETKDFTLYVSGDVRLSCNDEPINDEQVEKCFENGDFIMNNWFEVCPKDENTCPFDCSDSVCGHYDQAIATLADYQKELENSNL